jgi:hypothetical protein
MAIKGPALVHDSTNSSGLGSLTLNNNAAAGRRGLGDAVTEGHCANGDQVPYYISNATLAGPALVFERGLGTISSNGITLSRDTIRQSSDGTTKVDLPAGAQYDVVIGVGVEELVLAANNGTEFTAATFATNLGLPRLAAANTFTALNTIEIASGVATAIDLYNSTAGSTSNRIVQRYRLKNAAQSNVIAGRMEATFSDITAGAEDGQFDFYLMDNGTIARRAILAASGWLTASSVPYDAFPAGTKLLFGTAPPVGWTRVDDATTNRSILTSKAADTPGATGGSWTISGLTLTGNTGSTVLTESQIPSHTHPPGVGSGFITSNSSGNRDRTGTASFWSETAGSTGATGGGTGHTHTLSSGGVSSDGAWRPAYQIWAPATKN